MKFSHVIKLGIAIGVIGTLIYTDILNPKLLFGALKANPGIFVVAVVVYLTLAIVAGVRWYILVKAVGLPYRFKILFQLHMIGLFFTTLLPGGTGGDFVKGFYLYRDNKPGQKTLAVTSMIMDRIVGLYGMLTMGVIVCIANPDFVLHHSVLRWSAAFYGLIFLGFNALTIIFLSSKRDKIINWMDSKKFPLKEPFLQFARSLQLYGKVPRALAAGVGLTLIIHTSLILVYFLCLLTLGLELGFWKNAFAVPFLSIVNGIPISPAGIGITEAAGEVFYRLMGLKEGGSEILALVHLCMVITSLVGMPFYFLYRRPHNVSQ